MIEQQKSAAIEKLDSLSQDEYEALAKKIADVVAEHDTATIEYRDFQHHHGGETIMRLAGYSRERAHKLVVKCIKHKNTEWAEMAENEEFCDFILAFLCGDGCEVEWANE